MKKLFTFAIIALSAFAFTSCTENYANGERIGLVTQFSQSGLIWKSWEGHLNLTQTGMNSSSAAPFDFSIDNDHEEPAAIALIDSAANKGWKIKIKYHETAGKNWFGNRGETSHFVTSVEVLDRNPVASAFNGGNVHLGGTLTGNSVLKSSNVVHDTIYVVIVDKSRLK
jgi:hypothetical protein